MSDPQPVAPLSDAEIEDIRRRHHDASYARWGCSTCWLLAALDQERTVRQAAETALATEHEQFQAAEAALATEWSVAERSERREDDLEATVLELRTALAEERQARERAVTEAVRVLHRADSRLGLLLSRGGIQWGFGVGEQQEYSQVIGEIRSTIALLEETTHV